MKATPESELDPASMAAIRDLMASEPEPPVAGGSTEGPGASGVAENGADSRKAHEDDKAPKARRGADTFQPLEDADPRQSGKTRLMSGATADLKSKLRGYRPKPKHILIAAVVLLVLFRPWLVAGLLFITAFILTGVFLILGYDGFWHRAMGAMRWYAERRPARAEALHQRLDTFAMRFDAFLDRFPEGSVDGLYLPDFGEMEKAEARHEAALDRRFDSLRET